MIIEELTKGAANKTSTIKTVQDPAVHSVRPYVEELVFIAR